MADAPDGERVQGTQKEETMQKKKWLVVILGVLFFVAVTPAVAQAAGGGGGGLDAIPSDILTPLQAVTESIIRLAIFIMGLLLPLGVVVGLASAGFHHTLGNSYNVSSGLMLAIAAVAAFIFGMLMIHTAPMVAKSVSGKYLQGQAAQLEDITQEVQSNGGVANVDPEHLFDNDEVKNLLANLLTMVLRIILGATMLILFIGVALGGTQSGLGAVMANTRIMSSGLTRSVMAIGLLVLLIASVPLTKQIAHALLPSLLPGGNVVYLPPMQ